MPFDPNAEAILTSAADIVEEVGLKLIRKDSFDFSNLRDYEGIKHRHDAERLIAWKLEMKNSEQWTPANETLFQESLLREREFWQQFKQDDPRMFQYIWKTRVNRGLNEDVIRLALFELGLVIEPSPIAEKTA
jgi:hypothetical protein